MKISLVVPVFNEEDAIPIFYNTATNDPVLKNHTLEIIFINDGSSDNTENALVNLAKDNKIFLVTLGKRLQFLLDLNMPQEKL